MPPWLFLLIAIVYAAWFILVFVPHMNNAPDIEEETPERPATSVTPTQNGVAVDG